MKFALIIATLLTVLGVRVEEKEEDKSEFYNQLIHNVRFKAASSSKYGMSWYTRRRSSWKNKGRGIIQMNKNTARHQGNWWIGWRFKRLVKGTNRLWVTTNVKFLDDPNKGSSKRNFGIKI